VMIETARLNAIANTSPTTGHDGRYQGTLLIAK
jgi:hypothetical protein